MAEKHPAKQPLPAQKTPAREPRGQTPDAVQMTNAAFLDVQTILQLQRTIGNQAVRHYLAAAAPVQRRTASTGLAIQRKPANIDGTYQIKYDIAQNKKKHINAKAPRAVGLTRTKVINAQAKDGWVTPNEQLIGGHLFGAEFGGPDDDTNVVPWKAEREAEFSSFEEESQYQAMKDARAAVDKKLTLNVKTAATFVDRDDLKVSEEELTTAGWAEHQAGRAERKAKYDEVSERFSGIPTSLEVKITGFSDKERKYAPAGGDIAPAYVRNEDAIKPGYVPYKRYKRNATEPRVFNEFGTWGGTRRDVLANPLVKKLGHVAGKHGDHFGLEKNNEPDNLQALQVVLKGLVDSGDSEQILGTYMGKEVTHYVNSGSKLWLCVTADGDLFAAFKLSATQYDILIAEGKVG